MTYPIVHDRHLVPPARPNPQGRGGRHRKEGEPPTPATHHVLVYRIDDGHYVADRTDRGRDAHHLATRVTTVDVRREAVTVVSLVIPAAGGGTFTVQVTFRCTVTDPATVVREGVDDLGAILTDYLGRHPRIFELGRGHPLSAAAQFKASVCTQIAAYVVFMPPNIDGMVIALADVDIFTPAHVAGAESTSPASTHPARRTDADPPRTLLPSRAAGRPASGPTRSRPRGL